MNNPPVNAERVFAEAIDLPRGDARARLVAERCGNDTALQCEVESLLRAHDRAGEFLKPPHVVPSARVELPLMATQDTAVMNAAAREASRPDHPVSVLIVDDVSDTREMYAFYFRRQGQANTTPVSFSDSLAAGQTKVYENVVQAKLGLTSSLSLVLPIAVYLAGLGMVLPQGIAGALTPFPERAGAASSLFGFVQQSIAALCGAVVGALLGRSAWPLAAAVAAMGCVTLLLWLVTQRVRRAGAKH